MTHAAAAHVYKISGLTTANRRNNPEVVTTPF